MATPEPVALSPSPTEPADPARERTFRWVFGGLVILIVGFTAAAFTNGLYPCVPAAGSSAEPPLTDCAVALSPWIGVALVGLVLAIVAYRRVG